MKNFQQFSNYEMKKCEKQLKKRYRNKVKKDLGCEKLYYCHLYHPLSTKVDEILNNENKLLDISHLYLNKILLEKGIEIDNGSLQSISERILIAMKKIKMIRLINNDVEELSKHIDYIRKLNNEKIYDYNDIRIMQQIYMKNKHSEEYINKLQNRLLYLKLKNSLSEKSKVNKKTKI